jgi:hypothetical protein
MVVNNHFSPILLFLFLHPLYLHIFFSVSVTAWHTARQIATTKNLPLLKLLLIA